jgi:uncharacterized membrane protein YdjX (TVP38/TMEM64 family)
MDRLPPQTNPLDSSPSRVALRLALLVGVVRVIAVAQQLGLFDLLRDGERVTEALRGMGPWGYVLYVLSFALLEPFFVPGVLFVVPAAIVWPLPLAFGLSLLGSIGAGIVGFGFARFLARDWVSQRVPERLHRWDERLEQRGLQTVIVIRLALFLMPLAHWALGISRVRFAPFVLGTAIGFIPGIAALTYLGEGVADWAQGQPPSTWPVVGACAVALYLLLRWMRRSRGVATEPDR